jgi:cell division protein FtsI/penicillin-binding protein 2
MGQEVAVTPIQMLACISVVANGGLLVRPHLLSKILDSKGEVIKEYKPIVVRRVISEETAAQLRSVLKGAVEEGTGKMARLEEYEAAGKTGTSQKVEGGVYSHSKFVASFIGFAPADKPVISVCVMIDEPHPAYFGGVVSAPVFKEIADEVLRYMEVEPPADDKELTVKAKIRAA